MHKKLLNYLLGFIMLEIRKILISANSRIKLKFSKEYLKKLNKT